MASMPCLPAAPLDVVVFLLDDARFDQVEVFTETNARLAPSAVTFSRAYVTTPMCCPERASFLSGGYYAHQVGVLTNGQPNGGATRFDDTRTLAVRLREAGYATALIGKYLNDYELLEGRVPPGWSDWGVNVDGQGWTDFDVYSGSSGPSAAGVAEVTHYDGYVTDWQEERARAFLSANADTPRFLYLSFRAPHHPHTPARQDTDQFLDFQYRDRAWQEEDLSDKPAWIRALPTMTDAELATADTNNRERLQSLLAVDRAMAAVHDAVVDAGDADRTVFVLTSDNGTMFGEHRLVDKGVGYEEAVRIPLVVSHPTLSPRHVRDLVAMNLDLAATVQALAGLPIEGLGQSLAPALCGESTTPRDHVLLQAWPSDTPAWSGLVTLTHTYLESDAGDQELYDLAADPFQERSLHADPGSADTIAALAEALAAERGLTITTSTVPPGVVGEPYTQSLRHWGGVAPVTWSVRSGSLPDGLSLSHDGVLSGIPTAPGVNAIEVELVDAGVSPYDGAPQGLTRGLDLEVRDPAQDPGELPGGDTGGGCGCGTPAPVPTWQAWIVALAWVRQRRTAARGDRVT
jgi:N-acetylglucosamine-6-sulfatase